MSQIMSTRPRLLQLRRFARRTSRRLAARPPIAALLRVLWRIVGPTYNRTALLVFLFFRPQRVLAFLRVGPAFTQRILVTEEELDNLRRSAPIALRRVTRDLAVLRTELVRDVAVLERRLETTSVALRQHTDETLPSVHENLAYLRGRLEFVRRELMFELRYGAANRLENESLTAQTEILNEQKLAEQRRTSLRVNIGCGHVPLDGYLNVDRRGLPGVDIVAEADNLPFNSAEVDEVYSAHLLEHFPQEELRRKLLPHWHQILKPGGELRGVVPDADAMIKGYVDNTFSYENLREVTFGAQDYDGDFHYNMFVPSHVEKLLREAGFNDIQWIASGRRNGSCFEMEFSARKQ